MAKGEEYENWRVFREIYTSTRLTGCSGFIEMQKDTNDRHAGPLDIENLQFDSGTNKFIIKKVGIYNRFADTVWTFIPPGIVYPDGTPNPPSSKLVTSSDCPFP
jgi:hypothetical protein